MNRFIILVLALASTGRFSYALQARLRASGPFSDCLVGLSYGSAQLAAADFQSTGSSSTLNYSADRGAAALLLNVTWASALTANDSCINTFTSDRPLFPLLALLPAVDPPLGTSGATGAWAVTPAMHWATAKLAYDAHMAVVAAALNTTADTLTSANATGLGPLNPSTEWDGWAWGLGAAQLDDATHGAYMVAGVSLRAQGFVPGALDALALLSSSRPAERYAAASALVAESQLGCLSVLGGVVLGGIAGQPAALGLATAELGAATSQALAALSAPERLLAGSLAVAATATTLAAERGLAVARTPVPGSSTGLGGASVQPLRTLNQASFVSDVLVAAARQLLGSRAADAYRATLTPVGPLVAGLVDLLENYKTAALSMAAGTSVTTTAVSGLAPYANPTELLTTLAAAEQLYASAAEAVAAVGTGSAGVSSLDVFARDTLAARLARIDSNLRAIHTTLGLAPPAPALDSTGVAFVVGPLQRCQGLASDRWASSTRTFATDDAGRWAARSRGSGSVVVWPLNNCTDAFTGVQLNTTVVTLAVPGVRVSAAPLGLLSRAFYDLLGAQGPATLSDAIKDLPFLAMGLGSVAGVSVNGSVPTLPGFADALVDVVYGAAGSGSGVGAATWYAQPALVAAAAANAQLTGYITLARALFTRSAFYRYSLQSLEQADELVARLAVASVAVEAYSSAGISLLATAPVAGYPGPVAFTSPNTLTRMLNSVRAACMVDSSTITTPPPPPPPPLRRPPPRRRRNLRQEQHKAGASDSSPDEHKTGAYQVAVTGISDALSALSHAGGQKLSARHLHSHQKHQAGEMEPHTTQPTAEHVHGRGLRIFTDDSDFGTSLGIMAGAVVPMMSQLEGYKAAARAAAGGGPVMLSVVGAINARGLVNGFNVSGTLVNISRIVQLLQVPFYGQAMDIMTPDGEIPGGRSTMLQALQTTYSGVSLAQMVANATTVQLQAIAATTGDTALGAGPAPPPPPSAKKKANVGLAVGVGLGVGLGLPALLLAIWLCVRCRQEQQVVKSVAQYKMHEEQYPGQYTSGAAASPYTHTGATPMHPATSSGVYAASPFHSPATPTGVQPYGMVGAQYHPQQQQQQLSLGGPGPAGVDSWAGQQAEGVAHVHPQGISYAPAQQSGYSGPQLDAGHLAALQTSGSYMPSPMSAQAGSPFPPATPGAGYGSPSDPHLPPHLHQGAVGSAVASPRTSLAPGPTGSFSRSFNNAVFVHHPPAGQVAPAPPPPGAAHTAGAGPGHGGYGGGGEMHAQYGAGAGTHGPSPLGFARQHSGDGSSGGAGLAARGSGAWVGGVAGSGTQGGGPGGGSLNASLRGAGALPPLPPGASPRDMGGAGHGSPARTPRTGWA